MYYGGLIPAGYGAPQRVWLGDFGQGGLYESGTYGPDVVLALGEGAMKGAGTAAGAAGGAAALATAASMGGAAAAASTVPVAGWGAAAVIGTAATVVAMVGVIKNREVDKAKAVQIATALGIPDANNVQDFVLRAMRWDEYKVNRELDDAKKWRARYKKGGRATKGRYKKAVMKVHVLEGIKVIQKQARVARLKEEMGITDAPPKTAPKRRANLMAFGPGPRRGLLAPATGGKPDKTEAKAFPTVPVAIVGGGLVMLFLLIRSRSQT